MAVRTDGNGIGIELWRHVVSFLEIEGSVGGDGFLTNLPLVDVTPN